MNVTRHTRSIPVPTHATSARTNLMRKCACAGKEGEKCEDCSRQKLQRRSVGSRDPQAVPPSVSEVLQSSGEPLDHSVRSHFEARLGHDLGSVRIHNDARAHGSARDVNALAYTVGPHMAFAAGQYQPASDAGRRLIAHELVHTIQQGPSIDHTRKIAIEPPNSPAEAEAERVAAQTAGVENTSVERHADTSVARQEREVPPPSLTPQEADQTNKLTDIGKSKPSDRLGDTWGWGSPNTKNIYHQCQIAVLHREAFKAFARTLPQPARHGRDKPQDADAALGITSVTLSDAVPPQIAAEPVSEDSKTVYKLKPTHAEMPTIRSAATAANPVPYIEGFRHYVNQGPEPECRAEGIRLGNRFPIHWTITTDGAQKIQEGEQEHCNDIRLAFNWTLGRYASGINNLAAAGRSYGSKQQAKQDAEKFIGVEQNEMPRNFGQLVVQSLERDGQKWHTANNAVRPGDRHRPSVDSAHGCRAIEIIDAASLPDVGPKHPSSAVLNEARKVGGGGSGGVRHMEAETVVTAAPVRGSHDFGRVRVHADTSGRDDVFAGRKHRPLTVSSPGSGRQAIARQLAPGQPRPADAEFVTDNYVALASNPLYIDNFTNSANEAWLPNDRVLIFQYPNDVALKIGLIDLLKILKVPSELTPQPSEADLRKKYKIPQDLTLPQSDSPSPFITVGGKVSFYRDNQSGIIYPSGNIHQTHLPRISGAVRQIEAIRVNEELWQRAAPRILEAVTNMEWGVPRGFGPLIVSVGRGLKRGGGAIKGAIKGIGTPKPATPHAPPPQQIPGIHEPSVPAPPKAGTASELFPGTTLVGKGSRAPSFAGRGNALEEITPETKALLDARPDIKRALERAPRASNALKKCNSPCFPEFVSPTQVDRLERMLETAEISGIVHNQERLTNFLRSKQNWKEIEGALDEIEKDLTTKREVLGEFGEAGKRIGGDRVTPEGSPATTSVRSQPGTATGGEKLPDISGQWFPEVRDSAKGRGIAGTRDIRVAQIPGQVARKLRNMSFKNFDDFRETFWKFVANDPSLKQGWSPRNLKRMQDGLAPAVPPSQRTGGGANAVYQLNHKQALKDAGDVYDLNNIEVVGPAFHGNIGD